MHVLSDMVMEDFVPWTEENTREEFLKQLDETEKMPNEGYITVFDGKTYAEKGKIKTRSNRKEYFLADYRTVDVISQTANGSFGKDVDFIKYALYVRDKKYEDSLNNNVSRDLSNSEFAETASKTYGKLPLIRMLHNLNDSLALSQAFGNPVTVDTMHSPLLRVYN